MSDITEINETLERHVAAANAGDPHAYANTLADDVVYMPPDSPRVSGRDAVAAWMKQAFFDQFESNFQVQYDKVQVFGTEAFAVGSFTVELTPKSGGEAQKLTGKSVNAFRKQADSSWKYTLAIWNLDEPLG